MTTETTTLKAWMPKNMGLGIGAGIVIAAFLFREIVPIYTLSDGLMMCIGGGICFSIGCLGCE